MNIDGAQLKAEFNDLPTPARVAIVTTAAVELTAKVAALVDIARRPADKVRGPKWAWALAQSINGIGPGLYWLVGRR